MSVIGFTVGLVAGRIFNLEVDVIFNLVSCVVFDFLVGIVLDSVFDTVFGLLYIAAELSQTFVIKSTTDPIIGTLQTIEVAVVFSPICGIVFCVMFCFALDFAVIVLS